MASIWQNQPGLDPSWWDTFLVAAQGRCQWWHEALPTHSQCPGSSAEPVQLVWPAELQGFHDFCSPWGASVIHTCNAWKWCTVHYTEYSLESYKYAPFPSHMPIGKGDVWTSQREWYCCVTTITDDCCGGNAACPSTLWNASILRFQGERAYLLVEYYMLK